MKQGHRHGCWTRHGHETRQNSKKEYRDTTRNILLLLLHINKFIKFKSSDQQTN